MGRKATIKKRLALGKGLRVRRVGLHEEAAERLRRLIVRGALEPGAQLNEVALSDALGVSRTPLREALKLLAAEGLVELRRNRSPVVTSFSRTEIDELFETLAGVERTAAELAAERMTTTDLERLDELQRRMEDFHDRGKLRDYFDLNQQGHRFIVECARNAVLTATHEHLLLRVERARFFALGSRERWAESTAEHRGVLDALRRRDAIRAGELLARHVRRTGTVTNDIIMQAGKRKGVAHSAEAAAGRRAGRFA